MNPIEYLFKLNRLDHVQFMSIRKYQNAHGEVSNYNLIAAFPYAKAVQKDIKRLQAAKFKGMKEIARLEMLDSLIKNQNNETRSAQSQAQIDAYRKLGANSKVHIETKSIKVWAFLRKKTVLVAGVYPTKSKTIKELIGEELRLSTKNFRLFNLKEIKESALQGNVLEIVA